MARISMRASWTRLAFCFDSAQVLQQTHGHGLSLDDHPADVIVLWDMIEKKIERSSA